MSEGMARYAREGGTWILKLEGDVRHPLSPAVNAFLDRAFADPSLEHFLVDLSRAETIDSTNLGILARIANEMARRGLPRASIVAPEADIQLILRSVCFDRVFHIVTDALDMSTPLEVLPGLVAGEREMLALVLDTHRRLGAIDQRNRDAFRDVTELVERELRGR